MNKKSKFPMVVSTQPRPDEKMPLPRAASDLSDRPGQYAVQSPRSPLVRIVNPLRDFSEQTGAFFG
jgi:hypothetical protein